MKSVLIYMKGKYNGFCEVLTELINFFVKRQHFI